MHFVLLSSCASIQEPSQTIRGLLFHPSAGEERRLDKYPDQFTIEKIFSLWRRYYDAMDQSCVAVAKMCSTKGPEVLRFQKQAESWRMEARRLREEALRLS